MNKLVKVLEDNMLFDPKFCYIEYGAGRGRLSHEIAQKLKEKTSKHSTHILIERESRRLKFDRFNRDNPRYIRVRMDIMDFNVK